MQNRIVTLKEQHSGEKRVALDPKIAKRFSDLGLEIVLEKGAGENAYFYDEDYDGATITDPISFKEQDIIFTIHPPSLETLKAIKPQSLLIGLLDPYRNLEFIQACQTYKIDTIALEFIPRITRAQSMDVLSSQASIAGYEGVLIGAELAPRFFPMLTTAAGTIRPAKVVVIGAGVAGLQAIATARRLGAEVEAYDIRPAAKEQVESLGAKLIETGVDATGEGGYARELTEEERAQQAEALAKHIANAHVVVSTAAIPGRRAPLIITQKMVEAMPKGGIIVDLASETGGNCELTKPGETYIHQGITIAGPLLVASRAAIHASEMYAQNLFNLLSPFIEEGALELDLDDEIIRECMITRGGDIVSERIHPLIETPPNEETPEEEAK